MEVIKLKLKLLLKLVFYFWSVNTFSKKDVILATMLWKRVLPGHLGWGVPIYGEIFITVIEISVEKNDISGTWPAWPLIWTHQNFYEGKSGEARSWKLNQPGWQASF